MKKHQKLLLISLFLLIGGWLSLGFGFTTTLGAPISTLTFFGGLIGVFMGIIFFILSVKKSNRY